MTRPVEDIEFEQIYRQSKRHAESFGWKQTNADIAFVSGARAGVPALGTLNPGHWNELNKKWELDLNGVGAPPAVDYQKFKSAVDLYAKRFGEAQKHAALKRHGGQPWATNIRVGLREYVMAQLAAEIEEDILRARRVAGKRDTNKISIRAPIRVSLDGLETDLPGVPAGASVAAYADEHFKTVAKHPLRRRRGPIVAEILSDLTCSPQDMSIRFGSRVKLEDGQWGRVTSLRSADGDLCDRFVVLMNDLTTRVYTDDYDALALYVVDVAPREADRPGLYPGVRDLDRGI